MAAEAKKDSDNDNHKLLEEGIQRDWHFLHYLSVGSGSPLRGAMEKAKMNQEDITEWICRIWCPYGKTHDELSKWADEAKKMTKKHSRLAAEDAGRSFHKWISDSLEAGG